jgi:hypothetical protein
MEGAIALNYTGHGSPDVWAHEYVFEKILPSASLRIIANIRL